MTTCTGTTSGCRAGSQSSSWPRRRSWPLKPAELSFAEASVIPQSGAIALQRVEGSGPGGRILIKRRWRRIGLSGALAPGGRYRCVGGRVVTLLQIVTLGRLLGRPTGRLIGLLAVREGPAHFQPPAERCVAGETELDIDRRFPPVETPAILSHHGGGRARGKLVIEVDLHR